MIKGNLHTHTIYCDGKNTPEELVIAAIEKGFSVLGFSGHAYVPFDTRYCMSLEGTKRYQDEILRLKNKYCDKIKILCGLEYDYYSECDINDFDFIIGSLHYIKINDEYYPIDSSLNHFLKALEASNNDIYSLIKIYYATISKMPKVDIIGHFDLVTKYNQDAKFFNENDEGYLQIVRDCLEELMRTNLVYEINTGAMARGLRKNPYPNKNIIDIIVKNGGKLILSSDCHDAKNLDFSFDSVLASVDTSCLIKNPMSFNH